MKRIAAVLAVAGALCGQSIAHARDYLDTLGGSGWSPNSEWLALNPVSQDDLFLIAPKDGTTYLLKPVGDVEIDPRNVFAPQTRPKSSTRRAEVITPIIGSPGRSKLEAVEWAPDSRSLAYRIDRETRGIFSVWEIGLLGRVGAREPLPWQSGSDLQIRFELIAATKDRESRYWLRVVTTDGKVVKEIAFDHPNEIRQISLLRFAQVSLLSPNKQFLLYPKRKGNSWQLILEPVWGKEPARAITDASPEPPLQWQLAPDNRRLAVVENPYSLAVGSIDDWEHAERVPLPNLTLTLQWSSDGRFLAGNAREQLYLLLPSDAKERIIGDFILVSNFCAPSFWGWRGSKLYFSDFRKDSTNVYLVDAEKPGPAVLVVKPRDWQSAPRERTISPDGTMFVCLMMEQDSSGRLTPQLWKIDLRRDAEWERLYTFKPPL